MVRDARCDAVVAIGGGTALDIGKTAALLAEQERSPADHLRATLPLRARRCLLVLAPSTAGSGSEMTCFSVTYVDGIKRSLDDPLLVADYAIVDPNLTVGLSARVAASAALDALSQAIESFWSVRSTSDSRRLAAESLRLGLKHIEAFCTRPTPIHRAAMARAALLAGRAINVTRTTAPHAISYALTTSFGVPHGHSCALTLPAFLQYNASATDSDVADPRGLRWLQQRMGEILHLLGAHDPEAGRLRLIQIISNTGLESRLSALGLGSVAIERLVAGGFDMGRAANNPRRLTADGLRKVLTLSL
jgi:alcohol dehydrogenase